MLRNSRLISITQAFNTNLTIRIPSVQGSLFPTIRGLTLENALIVPIKLQPKRVLIGRFDCSTVLPAYKNMLQTGDLIRATETFTGEPGSAVTLFRIALSQKSRLI
jgi:hypothetical protein